MTVCLFCRREGLPRVPLTDVDANVVAAHVNHLGEPCYQGTTQHAHGQSLGDYPRDELLDDPDAWDLAVVEPPDVAVTVRPKVFPEISDSDTTYEPPPPSTMKKKSQRKP